MLKFLGGLPPWLTVALALASAAALSVVPYLAAGSHGWMLILSIALGAVFTMVAVGLPQLQQWQSKQESRLQVELMTEPSELTVPPYIAADGVIEAWLRDEKTECLSSLSPRHPTRPPRDSDTEAIHLGKFNSESSGEGPLENISYSDLRRIEKKKKSGRELTGEEERALAAFQTEMASIFKGSASGFAQMLSDPDQRTMEEYRSEVGQYLTNCRSFFDECLLWAYVKSGIGRLSVTLVNPTGRVFEGVQLEVYLPGKVQALDPDGMNEPSYSLPSRPRKFGARTPRSLITIPSFSGRSIQAYIPGKQHFGPTIDNSGSAKVVYRPVTLRPDGRVTFDDIALRIQEPPGTVVEGTWEATATNAEGRMRGRLSIKVGITAIPVRELLADLLNSLSH